MSEAQNNLVKWGLVGVVGVLFLVLLFQPCSLETYKKRKKKNKKKNKKVCWTECIDGGAPRAPGALALSPQHLTPWLYCQNKCAKLPLIQKSVVPGHQMPECPPGWRGVYNQNTAEWACTDAPVNHSPF
jgi:hypothetical protein